MASRIPSSSKISKLPPNNNDGIDDDIKDKEDSDGILANYKTLMVKHPYLVNAVQSAIISSSSVLVSQFLSGKSETDWDEVRAVAFIGAFWITPVLLVFYSRLQKLSYGFVGKLVIDQLIFSPIFTLSIITARLFLLGRVPFEEFPTILSQTVPTAVLSSWTFWIPARGFTLLIVPPHLHLLTGSAFSFLWNIILSLLLNA